MAEKKKSEKVSVSKKTVKDLAPKPGKAGAVKGGFRGAKTNQGGSTDGA